MPKIEEITESYDSNTTIIDGSNTKFDNSHTDSHWTVIGKWKPIDKKTIPPKKESSQK